MTEFSKGAYNIHEHNHVEWSDERLNNRLNELYENNCIVGYTGERLRQVQREMGLISFEIAERNTERNNSQIEQAWSQHGELDT